MKPHDRRLVVGWHHGCRLVAKPAALDASLLSAPVAVSLDQMSAKYRQALDAAVNQISRRLLRDLIASGLNSQ